MYADGHSVISKTSQLGNAAILHLLLLAAADINHTLPCGRTALHEAAKEDCGEVAKQLIAAGAQKDQTNLGGATPLHFAANRGHVRMVQILLQASRVRALLACAELRIRRRVAKTRSHHVASCSLQAGADMDKTDGRGLTPLYVAAARGYNKAAACLVEAGADKDKADLSGFTPLHAAVGRGHVEMTRYLVNAGANKDAANLAGITPMLAAAKKGFLRMARVLMEAAADVNRADAGGVTPLQAADERGHAEIVELLLEAGADPIHLSQSKPPAEAWPAGTVQETCHAEDIVCQKRPRYHAATI